jgi:hypothetical protein
MGFWDLFTTVKTCTDPKVWIGTIEASWKYTDVDREDKFFFHLYRQGSRRFYELSGRDPAIPVEQHHRYSLLIKPWIDCGDDQIIIKYMTNWNKSYWENQNTSIDKPVDKPKPDFKLLKFNTKDTGDEGIDKPAEPANADP